MNNSNTSRENIIVDLGKGKSLAVGSQAREALHLFRQLNESEQKLILTALAEMVRAG